MEVGKGQSARAPLEARLVLLVSLIPGVNCEDDDDEPRYLRERRNIDNGGMYDPAATRVRSDACDDIALGTQKS